VSGAGGNILARGQVCLQGLWWQGAQGTHSLQPYTQAHCCRECGGTASNCSAMLRGALHAGRDLVNMAKKRPNVIPIIEDARHPQKYRMLVPMVDVVFADVAQPDQARIVGLNAQYFLRNGGFFVISIKASCIDSTAPPEAVFAREVRAALRRGPRCVPPSLRARLAGHARVTRE
jgi:hypothetical protein